MTLLEREESEEYADLTRRIVGLLRRGKTVVVHCRGDLGRCALADLGSSVLFYPLPQLSTTSTSTSTGTQSGWLASRPGLRTSFIPPTMTSSTNLATSSA